MTESVSAAIQANKSFWQHKYGAYTANATLPAGQHDADVLIVGGGFTGLTTARELRRDDPSLKVMVIEASEIGFGASGRNGGFNMTLFGLEPEVTIFRWNKERASAAQKYMRQAVRYVRDLVAEEGLDSDYEHTGMWRLAYSEAQEKRLKKTYELLTELEGPGHYQYYTQDDVRQQLNTPRARAAIVETDTGILDPCKHVRALKGLAEQAGTVIHENTTATAIHRHDDHILIRTNTGTIRAGKLVMATNAWSHQFKQEKTLRNRQRPIWTYQIVTDPLTPEEWDAIRWRGRMSIEDNRQLVHYMRITACGRITIGGGAVGIQQGTQMTKWQDDKIWQQLEQHLRWLFPTLADKKVHYKWGGAVSVNLDMTPEICFLGDKRIIHASGCMGHGVSLTQMNGRVIADLLQDKDTERSKIWFVNRKAIAMPPGDFLSWVAGSAVAKGLGLWDKWEERKLDKSA